MRKVLLRIHVPPLVVEERFLMYNAALEELMVDHPKDVEIVLGQEQGEPKSCSDVLNLIERVRREAGG